MKKIALSLVAIVGMSSLGFAEGSYTSPVVYAQGNNAVAAAPIAADSEEDHYLYGGLGLIYHTTYSTDQKWFDDGTPTQDETGGFVGIIGYNLNKVISEDAPKGLLEEGMQYSVEGRINASLFDEDYSETFGWSIFLKPQYQIRVDENSDDMDFFSIYGLLGFGGVQVDGYNGNEPAHQEDFGRTILDEVGFQWGLGLSYTIVDEDSEDRSGDISLFVEYVNLMSDGDIDSRLYGYDPVYYSELSQETLTVGFTYRF